MQTQQNMPSQNPDVAAAADVTSAFVTLTLAGQVCGVPVGAVRDILSAQPITRIPLAPPEIAGSLNLRGRIVTSIDLRLRLGLPEAEPGAPRMSVVAERGSELYALLVDQVQEVLALPPERIERPPTTLSPLWAQHCTGVCRMDEGLVVLLDPARLIEPDAT
jgi:purine-binding chemotaxis protein CheW